MIEIKDIDFSYAISKRLIFDKFSLSLSENHIYGLLGKNGTGKSTLLYLICGLLQQQKGTIKFDGTDTCLRRPETLSEMFIVPEEYEMPKMSLQEYVKINSMFYPRYSADVLKSCLDDFELSMDIDLKALSMGQKKKVYMSMALAAGTKLLLMDEPTNGLDIPSKSLFRKVIANNMTEDRMLIISTHQVHDIESLLDHIIILNDSQLLLNASMDAIGEKYSFTFRQSNEMDDQVIYAEPTLQGNAAISKRQDGEPDTQINLELLFNAVTKGLIKE
jgi:ABC-2 type transport system ATP-binding protein